MLNRYGLFDIEKFLREQDEPPPEGAAQQAPPESGEEESPDDKVQKQLDKDRVEGLDDFREKHSDAIYQLVQAYRRYRKAGDNTGYLNRSVDERYDFNTQNRNLKAKFGTSGIDAPYMAVFDQEHTGLDGDIHVRFLTAIHGGRAGGRGRFMFSSPGEAKEFAETAGQLRPDLAFEPQRGDPRIVGYREQPDQEQPAQEQPEEQPAQPEGPQ